MFVTVQHWRQRGSSSTLTNYFAASDVCFCCNPFPLQAPTPAQKALSFQRSGPLVPCLHLAIEPVELAPLRTVRTYQPWLFLPIIADARSNFLVRLLRGKKLAGGVVVQSDKTLEVTAGTRCVQRFQCKISYLGQSGGACRVWMCWIDIILLTGK